MKSKTLREGAKCPVDICSAPTGVERRRTATARKMSLKRPAAGGESFKTGFFFIEKEEHPVNRRKEERKKDGILIKLFAFLQKKQKAEFIFILLILGISAALSQVTPIAIEYLTDSILAADTIHFQTAIPILLLILAANVGNETIKVARRLMVEDTATYIEKSARQKATEALLKAPLSYFRSHMTGNIHGRLNRNLEGTTRMIKLIFMDFAPAVTSAIAAIIVIFVKLPIIVACIIILVIPFGTFIVFRQISTQKGIRIELMNTKAAMDGTMVELLGGIETIRIMDCAGLEASRIEERSQQLREKEMKHHKAMAFYDCLKFVNEAVFHVVVIGITIFLAAKGVISIGTVLATYLCFTQLTSPLRELHRILDEFSESMVLAKDYFDIVEIPEDFSYRSLEIKDEMKEETKEIQLEDVVFFYPEKQDEEILHHVDFSAEKGKFIGIAGPSGCGKSTLIKLIARLEPYKGTIKLRGTELSGFSREDLAKTIALVPQTPFLIADTVFHNICYGMRREVSLEEVQEAARKANLESVIEKLPGKYDFMIAEGGGNLSGGQRQRIALARVFLRKPEILILDEATSALDNTSEKMIQREIEAMKEIYHTTIISIAHRLTTLENCDEIIVMDKGRIIQKGNFDTLKNTPGIFQDMYRGILK